MRPRVEKVLWSSTSGLFFLERLPLGTFMASIDITIVEIALPAIFRGIAIDPFTSFPIPALDSLRLQ